MSADTQTTVVPVVVKTKAPSLAAKHTRFMAFGYWFITNNAELVSDELRDQLFRKLNMFATVEEQTAFYDGFEGQLSEVNKTIRKMVAASKKPPKTKAPRAKKTKEAPQDELVAQLIADANNAGVVEEPVAEKKPKAPRAKKTKEPAVSEAPTTEPLAEPLAEKKTKKTKKAPAPEAPEQVVEPVATEAPVVKKPKAPRAKKTTAPATEPTTEPVSPELVAEPIVEPAAEPEKKAKKTKKTSETADEEKKAKKPKKTKAQEPAPEMNIGDIEVQMINVDGKEVLRDTQNNLYNVEPPHDKVGTLNPETGEMNLNA